MTIKLVKLEVSGCHLDYLATGDGFSIACEIYKALGVFFVTTSADIKDEEISAKAIEISNEIAYFVYQKSGGEWSIRKTRQFETKELASAFAKSEVEKVFRTLEEARMRCAKNDFEIKPIEWGEK